MSAKAATATKATTTASTTASENPTNVELLLKKPTSDLVKSAREHYGVENGQGKYSDDFYEKTLPEDVTILENIVVPQKDLMAIKNRLDRHDTILLAATALVHGEHSLAEAIKDPSLLSSTCSFKAGSNTFTHTFKRESEFRNIKTGEVGKKFATVQTSVKVSGTKGYSGELGRVRKHLQTLGAAILVN